MPITCNATSTVHDSSMWYVHLDNHQESGIQSTMKHTLYRMRELVALVS